MEKILTILFLFMPFFSKSQDTILITRFLSSKQLVEQYSVLKADKTIKHGAYTLYFSLNTAQLKNVKQGLAKMKDFIKVSGFYENGKKVGKWNTFSEPHHLKTKEIYNTDKKIGIWEIFQENGIVVERYDYDINEVLEPIFM